MKELVEKIEQQIATDKEVITVLPRNGIKAIKTLLTTIDETKTKYEQVNEMLLKDIERRYDELTVVQENEELPKLEQEILKLDVAIKNTDIRSSFEKMRLDKIVYNVRLPCFVWKGFPTFRSHLRMRPVSRRHSRRGLVDYIWFLSIL